MNRGFWKDRKVLITGHTGFKGGWLSTLLNNFGAKVYGIALPPATNPNLYVALNINERIEESHYIDITNEEDVNGAIKRISPDIVIHMAAQPLVRYSYLNPIETFNTNVMGTAHILNSVKNHTSAQCTLVITTDKVYKNREWNWGYREIDELGGYDPYSSSKACTEFVVSSFRNSYSEFDSIKLVTARAGNVIGGGDWSKDRLIPDIIESIFSQRKLIIRSPNAIRPWQHVIEPVMGYITLIEKICEDNDISDFSWNFGPDEKDAIPVLQIVKVLERLWGENIDVSVEMDKKMHETGLLRLDNSLAKSKLNWHPIMNIEKAIEYTYSWYKAFKDGADMYDYTSEQINSVINLK